MGILNGCVPRKDLLSGNINLNVFTASLGEVRDSYRAEGGSSRTVYTDAETFFNEGTYATENMKLVLRDVFSRLRGDTTAPLLKRLETGFGGGKTHTMIACLHIARRGREIAAAVADFLPGDLLPEPGEISVVAIAGEQIPVQVASGAELKQFPLWAEFARQIGGAALEAEVSRYLERLDSPDEEYFQRVFEGRKTLILIDELAHYAARWAVAYPNAREMLGSFFMSLFDHARRNPRIAIVVSLASVKDAFSAETSKLAEILTTISGRAIHGEDAVLVQESAMQGISAVLARDETVVIPVQAKDLSAVLAKRLFESIDRAEARRSAEEYGMLYQRNASLLPPGFRLEEYVDEMTVSYPFHPTLVELLNKKLSTAPTFQKTRGVLRILALAVRTLWLKKKDPSTIHACHLDFQDSRTVDELFGRTDNGALLSVVNADIGTADTAALAGGRSNAETADRDNPHPEGVAYHADTWKTVLLHSLAGQPEGLSSLVFGIAETDAILAVARPELTPAQVQEALKSISEKAYYLHFDRGRYYANTSPSINVPLSRIRQSLTTEQLYAELEVKLRKVVSENRQGFAVRTDIAEPQQIPDAEDRPMLGVVSLRQERIDPAKFIMELQHNVPRIYQNRVFLLVPETVAIATPSTERMLFDAREQSRQALLQELFDLARSVLAMKKLLDAPQDHSITHAHLKEHDFSAKLKEREKALETRVSRLCKYLVYPWGDTVFAVGEIRTAGGEGGEAMRTQIRTALREAGKLITEENITRETLSGLRGLFFDSMDYLSMERVRTGFLARRQWPVLESLDLLPRIVSEGVKQGVWCVAADMDEQSGRPDRFFDKKNTIPLDASLDDGWTLVTPEGAKKRGWGGGSRLTSKELRDLVTETLHTFPAARVASVLHEVGQTNGDAERDHAKETLVDLVRQDKAFFYEGEPEQEQRPEKLVSGSVAVGTGALDNVVVITKGEAVRRGWLREGAKKLELSGAEGVSLILGLLGKLGSLYRKGASTVIGRLDLLGFELPGGARTDITLQNIGPSSIGHMTEMLEILADKLAPTSESEVLLLIDAPDENCPLVREINERRKQAR